MNSTKLSKKKPFTFSPFGVLQFVMTLSLMAIRSRTHSLVTISKHILDRLYAYTTVQYVLPMFLCRLFSFRHTCNRLAR